MITDTYRAYVSGFFDGEGCVSKKRVVHNLVPTRSNSSEQSLEIAGTSRNDNPQPSQEIGRFRDYNKAIHNMDDGIVRSTQECVEADRNELPTSYDGVTNSYGHNVS